MHIQEAKSDGPFEEEEEEEEDDDDDDDVVRQVLNIANAKVNMVGILGRVGVRKMIVNKALRTSSVLRKLFDKVIWVDASSEDVSERNMHMQMAQQLSLNMEGYYEPWIIAKLLSLLDTMKFLLILDGISRPVNLVKLGIPNLTAESCSKVMVLTSLEDLCQEMKVNMQIKVEGLSAEQGWKLFSEKVGRVAVDHNIESIAKLLLEKCGDYLPIIDLMARALKEVEDVDVWMDALYRLETLAASPVEDVDYFISVVINFCLERLEEKCKKECLKYCALHRKTEQIGIDSLTKSWFRLGFIDEVSRGQEILNDLINAGLLKVKGDQFVRMHPLIRRIIVEIILPLEESKLFLMRGGLGLTKSPAIEEWEKAKEINLVDNEISSLPDCPNCPMLVKLFLRGNKKLRVIPSTFFHYMRCLRVLNLSRTRIRVLPISIFKLTTLQQLYLNSCERLMELPDEVGHLRNLEVLDLEGTKILQVPRGIECLTNLKILEVSIYGDSHGIRNTQSNAQIPYGMIRRLIQLEELNIDIHPQNIWWKDHAIHILRELLGLSRLRDLKLYLPELSLLTDAFGGHPLYLKDFHLIVGCHIKCLFRAVPPDVESEFESYSRCLSLVNCEDLSDLSSLLPHITALYLDHHHHPIETSVSYLARYLKQLKFFIISGCNMLHTLIDREDTTRNVLSSVETLGIYHAHNLRSICLRDARDALGIGLCNVKSLTLCSCPKLTDLFQGKLLWSFNSLEVLIVEDCPIIEILVPDDHPPCASTREISYTLWKLRKLCLHYLLSLVDISNSRLFLPQLEHISVYNCPNLKHLFAQITTTGRLRQIKGEMNWWKALQPQSCMDNVFVAID
ncbi:NB-ARC [Dillenia turbinata]|uniref:NB-ARC n=1 Tax=Dillenia turbinata TaxID=194707 RepID=A0AAN8YWW7_9MAGN